MRIKGFVIFLASYFVDFQEKRRQRMQYITDLIANGSDAVHFVDILLCRQPFFAEHRHRFDISAHDFNGENLNRMLISTPVCITAPTLIVIVISNFTVTLTLSKQHLSTKQGCRQSDCDPTGLTDLQFTDLKNNCLLKLYSLQQANVIL